MECNECKDTGVIETGNNDIPCHCLKGNTAIFNVVGFDHPITGAELRQAQQIRRDKHRCHLCR